MAAAVHPQDHTGRPQEVSEAANPDYYRLIKYFEELTGEGENASKNLRSIVDRVRPSVETVLATRPADHATLVREAIRAKEKGR